MPPFAVFTDLDGTLLDHDTYSFAEAAPALQDLKAHRIPLILASSKTAIEIQALQEALEITDMPAIVENGAGVARPGVVGSAENEAYRALRAALAALPAPLRAGFRGFGDMSPGDIAAITGLPLAQAQAAATRQFSEPGLWSGTDAAKADFLAQLAALGITARAGGRFLTLSFGATKADRLPELAQALGAPVTLALGDAPNDREMIEAADYGVIIRNPHGPGLPPLPGEATGRIIRTQAIGPAGWNEAVLSIGARLRNKDDTT